MKKITNHCIPLCMFFCMLLCESSAFAGNTKLHITTDKEKYNAAEIIQFQVFLLNPSAKINNTLFVELMDCNGNRLTKQMLPFSFNVSSGHIELPETGKAEFYLLYCYVNNADSMECSSVKKVFIKNNNGAQQKKASNKINVSHFFEGGTFVAESPNNILIQCTDENLNPVITKGKITNGKGNIYAVFETNDLGYAKVLLNPEDKVRYYIEVKDKNSNEGLKVVPIAAASGITLNTTITQSSIIYNLISYSGISDQLPDYRIEAVCSDTVVYDAAISFQNGLSAVKEELKRETLPQGFITFRLIDKSNKIHAQRVIYNSGPPAGNNFITVIDTVNNREAKVALPDMISGKGYIQIKIPDSASVIKNDLDFLEVSDQLSVNDQLIATTDEPNGFNAVNKETNRYLSLTGILQNSEKKPLKNKNVNVILLHKNLKKQYLVTKTDREGRLQIDNLIFFDTVTVYYQLADKSEEKNDVFLDLHAVPSKENSNKTLPDLNLMCGTESTDSSISILNPDEKTLNQVTITTARDKTNSEMYADKYVSGQFKRSYALRNEIDFIKNPEAIDNRSLWNYLQSSIAGIRVVIGAQGNPEVYGTFGCTVGVYLNDMELTGGGSLSFLNNLQIKDVAQVKYYSMSFKPKIIGGQVLTDIRACDGGDLFIYTKRDFNPSEEKTKGLPKTTVAGYTLEKKDYALSSDSPGYLFWMPEWNAESGQRIYVNVPLADSKKDVEIIIEGINNFSAPYRFKQKLVFK